MTQKLTATAEPQPKRPRGRPPKEIPSGLGQRLRLARTAAGLTIREVAERSGISPNTLVAMEAGGDPNWLANLRKVAQAIGCEVEMLVAAAKPQPPKTSKPAKKRARLAGAVYSSANS